MANVLHEAQHDAHTGLCEVGPPGRHLHHSLTPRLSVTQQLGIMATAGMGDGASKGQAAEMRVYTEGGPGSLEATSSSKSGGAEC